ncbi:hypothetical protein J4E93_008755 [Alternaria ventricosa]|uniref:uncharacterized protein n=1 Tax=Alternaria ventricosa TaxID=1187951 RepID=UPI0020C37E67|nr:uncharacterized protein J4E93_008755 [Alternaria ventricosa]KAI4639956.1 hypothetical protein J4E93_008755 [Alternaria ventricosa]
MTDLCGLPDELLLAVAKCLRDYTRNGYSDLTHLALSCRKLRPIAQEVFYTEVCTNPRQRQGLARLARTLLQRHDLASRVRKLSIELSGKPIMHLESCVSSREYHRYDRCTCGIPELGTHFIAFASTVESGNDITLHNVGWEDMLMRGVDTALVKLILCITPALSDLTLENRGSQLYANYKNVVWGEFGELFHDVARHKEFAECFQGLSSLTRLTTNGYPPCNWLSLPRLEAASINLFEDAFYCDDYLNSDEMMWYIAPSGTVSTSLTRLIIQADFEAFHSHEATHGQGVYGHMRSVVRGLTNLTHLFILYRTIIDPYGRFNPHNTPRGSFAHIVAHLESRSLTNLTLDVEPALKDLVRYMIMLEYTRDVSPMTRLAGLPKLRNLNAPQEAFFSANEEFRTCHLPATIESIGIMDSRYETKRYLKHLLDHQTKWPNLKNIKLGESPCNDRSVYPDEHNDGDASESDEGERQKDFDIDDSIYEQARSRGFQVEKVQDTTAWKKGWEGLHEQGMWKRR